MTENGSLIASLRLHLALQDRIIECNRLRLEYFTQVRPSRVPAPWTAEEHDRFLHGLETHGPGRSPPGTTTNTIWQLITEEVHGGRTVGEVQLHAHQYFAQLTAEEGTKKILSEVWTEEDDAIFEEMTAQYVETPDRYHECWQAAALRFPTKSADEIYRRYLNLRADIEAIAMDREGDSLTPYKIGLNTLLPDHFINMGNKTNVGFASTARVADGPAMENPRRRSNTGEAAGAMMAMAEMGFEMKSDTAVADTVDSSVVSKIDNNRTMSEMESLSKSSPNSSSKFPILQLKLENAAVSLSATESISLQKYLEPAASPPVTPVIKPRQLGTLCRSPSAASLEELPEDFHSPELVAAGLEESLELLQHAMEEERITSSNDATNKRPRLRDSQ